MSLINKIKQLQDINKIKKHVDNIEIFNGMQNDEIIENYRAFCDVYQLFMINRYGVTQEERIRQVESIIDKMSKFPKIMEMVMTNRFLNDNKYVFFPLDLFHFACFCYIQDVMTYIAEEKGKVFKDIEGQNVAQIALGFHYGNFAINTIQCGFVDLLHQDNEGCNIAHTAISLNEEVVRVFMECAGNKEMMKQQRKGVLTTPLMELADCVMDFESDVQFDILKFLMRDEDVRKMKDCDGDTVWDYLEFYFDEDNFDDRFNDLVFLKDLDCEQSIR